MAEATIGEALGILSKVSVNVDNRLKTLESAIGKTLGASTGGGKLFKNEPKKKENLVKEASPVIVTDFGRKAEQDLAKANLTESSENQFKDPEKGGFSFIKKLVMSVNSSPTLLHISLIAPPPIQYKIGNPLDKPSIRCIPHGSFCVAVKYISFSFIKFPNSLPLVGGNNLIFFGL